MIWGYPDELENGGIAHLMALWASSKGHLSSNMPSATETSQPNKGLRPTYVIPCAALVWPEIPLDFTSWPLGTNIPQKYQGFVLKAVDSAVK